MFNGDCDHIPLPDDIEAAIFDDIEAAIFENGSVVLLDTDSGCRTASQPLAG